MKTGGPIHLADATRAQVLRAFGPALRPLLRDRSLRVLVYGTVAILFAFVAASTVPWFALTVGPIVLGVPHLLADVRYLVAQPRLHRRFAFWAGVAAPTVLAALVPAAWVSMLAIVGAALVARAPWRARIPVMTVAGILGLLAYRWATIANVAVAHAHNGIAIVVFVLFARARARAEGARALVYALAVAATFFVLGAAILLGLADGVASNALRPGGGADAVVRALGPVGDPLLALRLAVFFAFAQSVHYAVWLRLVPEEARTRPGLRSIASSLAALRADVGQHALVLSVVLLLGFLVWGLFTFDGARTGYLRLATFHGPLELGAAALLLLERRFGR